MKKNFGRKIIASILLLALLVELVPVYGKNMQVQAQEAGLNGEIMSVGDNEIEVPLVDANKPVVEEEVPAVNETETKVDVEIPVINQNEPTTKEEETITGENEVKAEESLTPNNDNEMEKIEEISTFSNDRTEQENVLSQEEEIAAINNISESSEFRIEGFEQESNELIYSGEEITQAISVYHNEKLLVENIDYTLNYKNNINAAKYNTLDAPSVTIAMKGQYTGERTLYFSILPREIDPEGNLGYEQAIAYQEQIMIPAPVVYYDDNKLFVGRDFACDYSNLPENYLNGNSYEQGKVYTYEVKGVGNFTGSFFMSMVIVNDENLDFENADVKLTKYTYEYDGDPMTPEEVQIESVQLGGKNVDPAYYECKVQAEKTGTGYVEIVPTQAAINAGYRGRKKIEITLVADRDMKDVVLGNAWQEEITFSQKKIEENGGIYQDEKGVLAFEGTDGLEVLEEGKDYTIKYKNSDKAGTVTIFFYGTGRYKGTLKKTYSIVPNRELSVQWQEKDESGKPIAVYQKDGAIPKFQLLDADGYILKNRVDYTFAVKNNYKLGMMSLEIAGRGNYKGYEFQTEMEVVAADIGKATMIVNEKKYSEKPEEWKSSVEIEDENGRRLVAGKDYEEELIYSYEGMENNPIPNVGTIIYVTVQGKNNYAGSSLTGSYRICKWDLNDLVISIDAQMYTGQEIELQDNDIHIYANKKDKSSGKEITDCSYEILGYQHNVRVGLASVTLRGTGEYGGTRTCFFTIYKKLYEVIKVDKVDIEEEDITLGLGESRKLTVKVYPENAENKTIIWTSSDSEIASVNEEGTVIAKKEGSVTISAISQDTGKKDTCNVTVSIIPISDFELNVSKVEDYAGTTYQLEVVQVQPENASVINAIWESSDSQVVSVDSNGLISLNRPGNAVITVSFEHSKCVGKCLVWVKSENEETPEGNYLVPQMFKEVDDVDDTASFNRAINSLSEYGYDTVFVPEGTYQINAVESIALKSNMKLIMSPNAVLKAIGNSSAGYNIISLNNVTNTTISGGQIVGERYEHGNGNGEWGMGIGLYDSKNIIVSDVKISDCWGDGIYIGSNNDDDPYSGCQEITITNCILDNNRRNNLSIVNGEYITVDGCTFSNANGTAPEYGIDIEPNNTDNPCEHIVISNSVFQGNKQGAMGIITAADDITISNCTLRGKFFNWAGTNVVMSNTKVYADTFARIGISMIDGSSINAGEEAEDVLVASFDVGSELVPETYNQDSSNTMMNSYMDSSLSPSGKVLRLERTSQGTKESGYYFDIADLLHGSETILEPGSSYRFEYTTRGYGQWGIKTDQTGWYPCVPQTEQFSTGITTYTAKSIGQNCRLMFYAVDMTKGMCLEIDSIKIYKVN